MDNDEINLLDYVKVIIRQRYTIVGVMVVGMVIALCSYLITPKVYQATGYYKEIKVTKRFFSKPIKVNLKQIVAEAKIKYPAADIAIPKDTEIISIKTTGATQQEAKFECIAVAATLPIEKIMNVRSKLVKSKKKGTLIIASFIFLAFFSAFIKEWWEKNKGEL